MDTETDISAETELKSLVTAYLAYSLFLKRLEADPDAEPTLVYAIRILLGGLRDEFRTALQMQGIIRWSATLQTMMDDLLRSAGGDESRFLSLVPIRL